MKGIIYSFIALLLIANLASAQEVAHLRGAAFNTISGQRRNLADEPVVDTTEEPALQCRSPYYNNGVSCELCRNGIVTADATGTQECTPCVAPNYISFNECVAECSCAEVDGWTATFCGYYAFKTCGEGFIGNARRLCSNSVFQAEDRSGCLPTERVVEKSGAGMVDIPITFADFPPYVDNSEIPLYVSQAALKQYPYQLNELHVTMENPYDTNEGANDQQIAHLMIGSNAIYGKKILSTTEESVANIGATLTEMNSQIFNKDVIDKVSAPADTDVIDKKIERGMCEVDGKDSKEEFYVGYTITTTNQNEDLRMIYQCTQENLFINPYTIMNMAVAPNSYLIEIVMQTLAPIDFIKSNFYREIYGFILGSVPFPKRYTLVFEINTVDNVIEENDVVRNSIKFYLNLDSANVDAIKDLLNTSESKAALAGFIGTSFADIDNAYSTTVQLMN